MRLHGNTQDLTGRRFGRLVVSAYAGKASWECVCDCGNTRRVLGKSLRGSNTQSCGCYMRERNSEAHRKHGKRDATEYRIWSLMKDRCLNKGGAAYKNWGGRGITICKSWVDSFEQFMAAMGPRPPGGELDRIDNDGPYEPSNCRWADRVTQANNKRNNVKIEVFGETRTVAQWAREYGISEKT